MKIYILLSITFLLFTTGCKKDETSEPDYYFELKIGDEEYNTDSDKLLGEE